MNAANDPLEPEVVDELLSAELDGELDAAARDHGLSADEARARISATPGVGARRQALADARRRLGTPAPPLGADRREAVLAVARSAHAGTDELSRRRRRFSGSRVAGVAAAAAAVLLVVGLAVSIATTGSDDGDDANASGDAATESATTVVGDMTDDAGGAADDFAESTVPAASAAVPEFAFGSVGDDETLRALVSEALGLVPAPVENDAQASERLTSQAVGVSDACLAAQTDPFDVAAAPTLRGPVDYRGTDGEVLVFAQGDDFLVLTVATDDCRLLVSQFVHPEP